MNLSKSELVYNIKNELGDNVSEAITPYHVRHNLLDIIDSSASVLADLEISSKNFGSPDTRSTIAGQFAIEKLHLNNYLSIDNSAFGYSALRDNYVGARNTALGSKSLGSNVTGNDNIAIGLSASYAVTTGSSNIAIGNYSLLSNRSGSHNIAIGHGAGYYIDADDDYQFFLGTRPATEQSVCDDETGANIVPMLKGDLLNNRLGVNTKTLPSTAVIQTSGDIAPVLNDTFSLGLSDYIWDKTYSSNVYFSSSDKLSQISAGNVEFNFNLLPSSDSTQDIGSTAKRVNVYAGTMNVTTADFVHSNHYLNKTIHLGSKVTNTSLDGGGPNTLYDYIADSSEVVVSPHLNDANLSGAGLKAYSSDNDRFYEFGFVPSANNTTPCVKTSGPYTNAYWRSNISLELGANCYIKSDHVVASGGYDVRVAYDDDCQLMSIDQNKFTFGDSDFLNNNTAGHGFANFVCKDELGAGYDASLSVIRPNFGQAGLNLLYSTVGDDGITDSHGLRTTPRNGFQIYTSTSENHKKLTIGSYDGHAYPQNKMILREESDSNKVVLITDGVRTPLTPLIPMPEAALHIETSDTPVLLVNNNNLKDSEIRVRSANTPVSNNFSIKLSKDDDEISNLEKASVDFMFSSELQTGTISLGGGVAGTTGFSATDRSYEESEKILSLRRSSVSLFGAVSGVESFTLNIGDESKKDVSIGLHLSENDPVAASGYGGLFMKPKENNPDQTATVMFVDTSGNKFDLVQDSIVRFYERNTFVGSETPKQNSDSSPNYNTSLGYKTLEELTNGEKNTVVGDSAGKSLTIGKHNTVIGYNSFSVPTSGEHNICIGTDGVGNNLDSNYNFVVGVNDNNLLMRGKMGPDVTDKALELPKNGRFVLHNSTDQESLQLTHSGMNVVDLGGSNTPDGNFTISFTGNDIYPLFVLNHQKAPLTNLENYSNSEAPYAQIKGDLRVRGAIRFAGGSSIENADFFDTISSNTTKADSSLSKLSALIVEGTADNQIAKAASTNSPSQGSITTLDGSSIMLHNRDPKLLIKSGDYVVAIKIGEEYRPISVSMERF